MQDRSLDEGARELMRKLPVEEATGSAGLQREPFMGGDFTRKDPRVWVVLGFHL